MAAWYASYAGRHAKGCIGCSGICDMGRWSSRMPAVVAPRAAEENAARLPAPEEVAAAVAVAVAVAAAEDAEAAELPSPSPAPTR